MKDLIYTATPQNEGLAPITVKIGGVSRTGATDQPKIELYRDGEPVELERPYIAELKHWTDGKGDSGPSLALNPDAAEQLFGIRPKESRTHVKLDREWREDFRAYAQAAQQERHAEAREKIFAAPDAAVKVTRSFGMGTYYHARGVEDEQVREYLNHLLQADAAKKGSGVGPELEYQIERDGGGYCDTTVGELMRLGEERLERVRKEKEEKERRERERQEAEGEAAGGRDVLRFHCELKPHTEDLSGEILNRPAPQGGWFLLRRRLPKSEWARLKEAGATYWSKDDLEQMDLFWSEGGWRYSLAALEAALGLGYAVQVNDELPVTTTEDLHALFFEAA